jgi:hypothetical protein
MGRKPRASIDRNGLTDFKLDYYKKQAQISNSHPIQAGSLG